MGEAAKKWMAAVENPSGLVAENSRLRDDLGERDEYMARLEMRYENDANGYAEREKQLIAAIDRLKAEIEAAPHWVPVAEWVGDYGWHYVAASNGLCYDARRKGGMWFAAYAEGSLGVDVTHVLVGLNPPVSNEDPRGDGDLLPGNERLDNLTRECMRDELTASLNGTESAMRRRLMEPFLGSEAEKLGATKYQLRDGERWQCKSNSDAYDQWDEFEFEEEPAWLPSMQYRLNSRRMA